MRHASVRNIAKEAGLSLGALRHYFTTQDELLAFAMRLVKERVTARILEVTALPLPPKDKALRILFELVPADRDRMAEMEVWFAFIYHARFGEGAGAASPEDDGIREGLARIVYYLAQEALLKPGLDPEAETERLYALVDGLALHAMLNPERLDGARIERVLAGHLASICV